MRVVVGSGWIGRKRNKTFILLITLWKYGYLFFVHLRNNFSAIFLAFFKRFHKLVKKCEKMVDKLFFKWERSR